MSKCVIDEFGNKRWYNSEGKLHRLDGPAIEYIRLDGLSKEYAFYSKLKGWYKKLWYFEGKRHRLDGPAVEWANGDKCWYVNGELHRLDGPAMESLTGSTELWYFEGKRHRLDGPAIKNPDGHKEWWYYGEQIECSSIEEFTRLIKLKIFW